MGEHLVNMFNELEGLIFHEAKHDLGIFEL